MKMNRSRSAAGVVVLVMFLIAQTVESSTSPVFLWFNQPPLSSHNTIDYRTISQKDLAKVILSEGGWSSLLCAEGNMEQSVDIGVVLVGREVKDTHIAKKEEDIGYYAGFVGASFMFGRALTSTLWGIISDRYGRRPVMIFGTASIVVFNTLFGFSTSFWMAITTRFLLGLMNGVLGPFKAYASEISRPEHQSLALSLVSTAWGIGLIIGPAIGGFLAQPADKFPGIISQDSIFGGFRTYCHASTYQFFQLLYVLVHFGFQ